MEVHAALGSSPSIYRTIDLASRSSVRASHRPDLLSFDPTSRLSAGWLKGCRSISLLKQGSRRLISVTARRNPSIRASSEPSPPIAPLELESPTGQFLSQILISHPHLLPAAVDQQLQLLRTEAEKSKDEPSPTGTDLVLYKRIAEVKAKERTGALEEILYALVVQKFVEADVTLVPTISRSSSNPSERVDHWLSEDEKLERLHSSEVYEMIKNHLALILGNRFEDPNSVSPISKLRVGQVYAASVMYGYFLKRVDQRFQLEKSMKSLPWGSDDEERAIRQAMPDESRLSGKAVNSHPEVSSWSPPSFSSRGFENGIKPTRLRSYVMSFDSETLQMYATIRSKEAFSIVEKHTEALFGRPEIVITPEGTIDSSKDEIIKISFGGLRRLIVEAVTFGSFLWDVESYVDRGTVFVTN